MIRLIAVLVLAFAACKPKPADVSLSVDFTTNGESHGPEPKSVLESADELYAIASK